MDEPIEKSGRAQQQTNGGDGTVSATNPFLTTHSHQLLAEQNSILLLEEMYSLLAAHTVKSMNCYRYPRRPKATTGQRALQAPQCRHLTVSIQARSPCRLMAPTSHWPTQTPQPVQCNARSTVSFTSVERSGGVTSISFSSTVMETSSTCQPSSVASTEPRHARMFSTRSSPGLTVRTRSRICSPPSSAQSGRRCHRHNPLASQSLLQSCRSA